MYLKVRVILFSCLAACVLARLETLEDYMESLGLIAEEQREAPNIIDPKVACVLPAQRGHCRALILRWRYDPVTKDCKEFKFGGCGGNANNFSTKKQCLKFCKGI